jgi:hypothetical protein
MGYFEAEVGTCKPCCIDPGEVSIFESRRIIKLTFLIYHLGDSGQK